MNIGKRKKGQLFKKIYELEVKGDGFLYSIPSNIRSVFYDNDYVESLNNIIDLLLGEVFTESEKSDMNWFIYEWTRDNDLIWIIECVEYRFSDIDQYIDFLYEHHGWSE